MKDRIHEICATLNRWAGQLTGLDFADERGWLSDDERAEKAELQDSFQPLTRRGRATVAGAERDRHRALRGSLATCSPQREFDFWAMHEVTNRTSP